MNTSVKLAQTLASHGASHEEILSVLTSKGTNAPKPVKQVTKSTPVHKGAKGSIAQAIANACPSNGNFTTKELVQAALKAGSKNLASATQAVAVFLSACMENKTAKRTGRGTYVRL